MKKYLRSELINAEPEIRKFRRYHPDGSCTETTEEGYKTISEDGCESWLPKEVFEKAYRPINNLTFGLAIEALKQGKKVARIGWNGKGMFLFLDNSCLIAEKDTVQVFGDIYEKLPSICKKTADNKWLTGWLASQTDMLAEDWVIL